MDVMMVAAAAVALAVALAVVADAVAVGAVVVGRTAAAADVWLMRLMRTLLLSLMPLVLSFVFVAPTMNLNLPCCTKGNQFDLARRRAGTARGVAAGRAN